MNIQIEALPEATELSNEDVFVINKPDSYTAKIRATTVKQSIVDDVTAYLANGSITGSLSTFTTPLTASGEFLVLLVNNKAKAVRIWDFA